MYQAQLLPSNKEVAVKTCRDSNNEQFKNQFIEEAEVLKKFSHKNVVRLMGELWVSYGWVMGELLRNVVSYGWVMSELWVSYEWG